ncbi:sugar ABC transporter ATP-binding protein [Superficieibacter electus]|uniref:Sugar ABC transporter ATP-binding protein n=1 Tax=Superficieibacter electus TaxID=2022662 RepID=A0A2P5GVQ0_9ENTR|nr:sn-glycerol-3-phosphate ABC transporter ATP-binding protein UgpC [Superficieibacter electus]POP47623.1 sugar ABC transporter ATP-binding protein [Superficieibacter electus]POP50634.1 sugar ABC transporter ATP-binding protein [Superficieibacter electus]
MATLKLHNISKTFNGQTIIPDLNLTIQGGEFIALVGPSGCGKSTLLRMIAGLESVDGGEMVLEGEVINDLSPQDRNMAMVFQNYALYPHMTVAENLGFSLKMQRVPASQIDQQVRQAAETLGLTALLTRKPAQLSGGQRQRVAMGRAILRHPRVFLFDEPLSNLDAKLRVELRSEIKALHQRLNTTMIYVTHDQIEAMTMADRIVVLRDGHIEQVGTPLELYDRPANAFVASFIGSPSMNLFSGRVEQQGVVVTDDGIALPVRQGAGVDIGQRVVYGVRPQHFILTAEAAIDAQVNVVEPTGSETQILLNIGQQKVTTLFHQRVTATPGETLKIAPDARHAHLFDATSGLRLN